MLGTVENGVPKSREAICVKSYRRREGTFPLIRVLPPLSFSLSSFFFTLFVSGSFPLLISQRCFPRTNPPSPNPLFLVKALLTHNLPSPPCSSRSSFKKKRKKEKKKAYSTYPKEENPTGSHQFVYVISSPSRQHTHTHTYIHRYLHTQLNDSPDPLKHPAKPAIIRKNSRANIHT